MTLRSSSFKKIDSDIMIKSIRSQSPRSNGRKNSINLSNCEPVRVMLETTSAFKNLAQDIKRSESDCLGVEYNDYGSKFRHKSVPHMTLPEPAILFSPRPISELDAAAVKLQKVYKSYRTRRNLADCAVVVEELWWKALDFAALKRSSVSYFNVEKAETAVSRWSRARTRAAKVGKGLSKCEKAQKLALQHWLEAIDPRHRYGHNLHMYYDIWFDSESSQPFFYWLDVGDGKEVNVERCPRSSLQRQCIQYLGPIERETYEVIVEGGKLLYRQNGLFVDTIEGSKWIFVLSTSRNLYVGQKKKGVFQHSSFLSGGATLAAGRLVAHGGVLKAIWPYSGHYHPTEENFREFISFLKENHVDLANVKRCAIDDDYLSCNIDDMESISQSSVTTDQPEDKNVSDVNVAAEKSDGVDVEEPMFRMARRLSCKWSSGAGARIGCVRDYPTELQFQALEQVNLSPRVASGPACGNYGPIPSPRPSPKVRLSPGLSYMDSPVLELLLHLTEFLTWAFENLC